MADISEYEQQRLKNIEENRRMLIQLGLLSEESKPPVFKPTAFPTIKKQAVKRKRKTDDDDPDYQPLAPSRRSSRSSISSYHMDDDDTMSDSINGGYASSTTSSISSAHNFAPRLEKPTEKRPQTYGAIDGVPVGESWETRMQCSYAGIHRPTVAGIHPGPEGAYSIALSGGYEDNYDGGESFTYTGAGGRDLKGTKDNPKNLRTGPQVRDQSLAGANGALAASVKTRNPVRVIRGYKSSSVYAPEVGYRYDGLYQVEDYWTGKGQSGHIVYKFALKRCPDQDPPPWDPNFLLSSKTEANSDGKVNNDENSESKEETKFEQNKCGEPNGGSKPNLDEEQKLELNESSAVSDSSLIPFVDLGVKVDKFNTSNEFDDNLKPIKRKSHSPKVNKSINNNVNDTSNKGLVKNNLFLSNQQVNGLTGNSPAKNTPKSNSPKNKSDTNDRVPESPVKMMASNQSTDNSLGDAHNNSSSTKRKTKHTVLDDYNDETSITNNNYKLKLSIPESDNVAQNNSPSIDDSNSNEIKRKSLFGDLSGKHSWKSNKVSRSSSPDDFAKICDELCNELPKIEKVKRLRFSFENMADNAGEMNANKSQRKKVFRFPRKSSFVSNEKRPSSILCSEQNKHDNDLIFSKYIDNWLPNFTNVSQLDWLGWEEYESFKGWSDKELSEAKKYSASFADFLFKSNECSEENSWAGWEGDVSRRSLVLNGFLLEKISRNRKNSESDETDVPEVFHDGKDK